MLKAKALQFNVLTIVLCAGLISGCAALQCNSRDMSSEKSFAEEVSSEDAIYEEAKSDSSMSSQAEAISAPAWASMKKTGDLTLDYASEFSVDFYDDYSLITISGTDRYLLIPKDGKCPSDLDRDIIPVETPETIYLAASAGMDYFRVLNSLDKVRMTSTQAVNWSLPEVVSALETEDMLYAGKYSAPDYELLLKEGTDLAIESTMVYHVPEVKEKIEKLGIPVLVDKSSYEKHPLGRMEWIKLYGLLLGIPGEADAFYDKQIDSLRAVPELSVMLTDAPASGDSADNTRNSGADSSKSGYSADSGPTVAYFYITSSGTASIRRPGDYISRMIELAGGIYAFGDISEAEDSSQASMTMQMEAFLDRALDSDILIYSTSIDSEIKTLEDLYAKVPMLRQSRAAAAGNIWITGKNMYQQTTAVAQIMLELHEIVAGNASGQMEFFTPL